MILGMEMQLKLLKPIFFTLYTMIYLKRQSCLGYFKSIPLHVSKILVHICPQE